MSIPQAQQAAAAPKSFEMQLLANCCSIVHCHHLHGKDFTEFRKKYLEYKDAKQEPGSIAPFPHDWSRNILWIDNYYAGNGQWLADQMKKYGTVHHLEGVSCNSHSKKPAHVFLFVFDKDKDQNWLRDTFRQELAEEAPRVAVGGIKWGT